MKLAITTFINIIGWILIALVLVVTIRSLVTNYDHGNIRPQLNVVILFIALSWIFVGANASSFSYSQGQSHFRPRHYAMLGLLFWVLFSGEFDIYKALLPAILLFTYLENYVASKFTGVTTSPWRQSLPKALPLKSVLQILNERFIEIEVTTEKNKTTVKGKAFLAFEINVDIFADRTDILIQMQSTPLVFILGWKLAPFMIGAHYGKKFQKEIAA